MYSWDVTHEYTQQWLGHNYEQFVFTHPWCSHVCHDCVMNVWILHDRVTTATWWIPHASCRMCEQHMTASWMCEYYLTASQLPCGEYHMAHMTASWMCTTWMYEYHMAHMTASQLWAIWYTWMCEYHKTWRMFHTWLHHNVCVPHGCVNTTIWLNTT